MGEWVNTQPGILAWEGTDWQIHYAPADKGDFALYQGERFWHRSHVLEYLKGEARQHQKQLEEIGVA